MIGIRHPHLSTPKVFFLNHPRSSGPQILRHHCGVLYPMSLSFLMDQTGKCHQCFSLPWTQDAQSCSCVDLREGSCFCVSPTPHVMCLNNLFLMFVVCIHWYTTYSMFWCGIVKSCNVIGSGMFYSNNIQRYNCSSQSDMWYMIYIYDYKSNT